MLLKIISGGQTGVDQAALDAAIHCGISYGGWLPAGRMTEDGPLSSEYIMNEMKSSFYPDRTRKNIEEADATLIISRGDLTGGSELTENIARKKSKPFLHIDLNKFELKEAIIKVVEWLRINEPEVLNCAGPRASSDENIYRDAFNLITKTVENISC